MRRKEFLSDRARAIDFLARAPFVHVAGVDGDGFPVAKTMHGVVVGDRICFHAAPAGEKMAIVGKPVVVWTEEVVAEIPSYFMDKERACPATTLYESAQVHGVLERIDDVDAKAAVLQALMRRYQPEGGHRPITAGDPMYAAAVKGILILGVSLDHLDGKAKLAQNRTPAERRVLLERLWQRGGAADARAVDLILDANRSDVVDAANVPAFLAAPAGFTFRVALHASFADEAAAMLDDAYWNVGVGRERIAKAHVASQAWVGAVDADGKLAASARALADGAKWGTIYDVIVRTDCRARGLGTALVKLLLDHPAVRGCRKVNLRTRDAQAVYARVGFVEKQSSVNTEMLLER